MQKLKGLSLIALISVLIISLFGCSSTKTDSSQTATQQSTNESKTQVNGSEVIKMQLGHVFAVDSVTDRASKYFAELVNKKTNGQIEIAVFPAGQLGGDEALGQDLSRGTIDLAFLNQGSLAGLDPLLDFHYLPYIAENYEQVDKLYYGDGIIPTTIKETLAKHGIRTLGFFELEFRGLTNSKHPVKKLEDLKGLKLRVPGSRSIKGFFEAAGVQTVAIPMPELYTSLQQGVVDGQDNGLIITYDNKLHEPNPYITRTNHVYASGSIVVSEKTWEKLSPEQQRALEEAGKETQAWQIKENRQKVASYVDKLKEEGIEVIELSPEEMAKFRNLGRSLWDKWSNVYGVDRIAKLREEIKSIQQ